MHKFKCEIIVIRAPVDISSSFPFPKNSWTARPRLFCVPSWSRPSLEESEHVAGPVSKTIEFTFHSYFWQSNKDGFEFWKFKIKVLFFVIVYNDHVFEMISHHVLIMKISHVISSKKRTDHMTSNVRLSTDLEWPNLTS